MPFINIAVSGLELSSTDKQRLIVGTTELMKNVLHKNEELTAVRLDELAAGHWAIGGVSMEERGDVAVHMDINITRGTNNHEQMALMIEMANQLFKDVLGLVAEASYIIIHELDATCWGYNGITQYNRAH